MSDSKYKGKILVLIGLPGSGKSTYAENLMADSIKQVYRVNWDELRKELKHPEKFNRQREEDMKKESIKRVEQAAKDGAELVIIDNTNLSEGARNMWRGVAQKTQFEYEEFDMNIPLEYCIERDAQREGNASVGRAVIERMALFANRVVFDLDFLVLDIDGTIADLSHRRHFIETEGKKDHDSFFSLVHLDKPIEPIIELARMIYKRYSVIIVSGRPIDRAGKATVKWLRENNVPFDHIFMRQGGDHRPDTIVKKEILDKLPKNKIRWVFDDRSSVVKVWRDAGLTYFQVAEGDF